MAVTTGAKYFLLIDGLNGGSTDAGHEGWFEISGYDFDVTKLTALAGGGGGAGRAEFDPLSVTLALDTGLADLLATVAAGQHIRSIKIEGVTDGEARQRVFELKLGDVTVSQLGGGSGPDQLTFDYGRIGVTTWPQEADGSLGPPNTFSFDVAASQAGVSIPEPSVGASTGAVPVPTKYFLLIDGVDGGSTDPQHQGWFEISAYDLHVANLMAQAGGGGSAGNAEFDPLTVTLALGSGLTDLLAKAAAGKHIRSIKIEGVTAGEAPQTVFALKLGDVAITKLGEGDGLSDQLSFQYSQISVTTWPQRMDGSLGAPDTFSFDLARDQAGASIPDPATGAGGGASVPVATTYFLLVDGVNGASTDVHHQGWFEIDGYQLDIAYIIAQAGGGGGGAGKTEFDPLAVSLSLGSGLTDLLAKAAAGQHIRSIKIEGVTAGATPQTVFALKLGDVTVGQIDDGSGAEDRLAFNYGQISVTTWPQQADGSLGAPDTFSFDLARNQSGASIGEPIVGAAAGGGSVPAATRYFLLVDGVNGGSTDAHHAGWFEIDGYDLDVAYIAAQAGGGGGSGRAEFDPLAVTLSLGSGLTDLLAKAATGQHIRSIKIEGVTAGEAPQTVFQLKLGDVTVGRIDGGSGTSDQLSFNYGQIGVTTWPQQADGSLGAPGSFSFDLARNQSGASIGEPTVGAATGQVATPTKYFLLVDGVDGGSVDALHRGWFEISGYDLDIANLAAQAGGGAGRADFSPLTVTLSFGSGLTELLSRAATGQHIRSIKIEGVTAGGAPQAVFQMKLGEVTIGHVTDGMGAGDQLSFNYGQISVTTVPQQANGALGTPSTFSFDLAGNQSGATIPEPQAGASPGFVAAATRYFLRVDGVDGGSTDEHHQGWFEISGYDLDIAGILAQAGGGSGAGRAEFGPLTVTLSTGAGLPDLLTRLAGGRAIRSIKIEGVSGGVSARTVFEVRLEDVALSHIGDGSGSDDQLSFRYNKIFVVAHAQLPNGQAAPQQEFGFNLVTNEIVPVCYCAGTRIATPDGERCVETLAVGDAVLTASGEIRAVLWIGRQTVSTTFANPLLLFPIRIAAGALGQNVPSRDLFVSPDHALLMDGVLAQAGALVNGTTVQRVSKPAYTFVYYHIELDDHALILAEGTPAETFVDNVTRRRFDNYAEYEARFGARHARIAELTLPRVKAARQLPRVVRERVAARAAALGFAAMQAM